MYFARKDASKVRGEAAYFTVAPRGYRPMSHISTWMGIAAFSHRNDAGALVYNVKETGEKITVRVLDF